VSVKTEEYPPSPSPRADDPLTVRKKDVAPERRSLIECSSENKAREPNPAVKATRINEPVK
jgi:hypothetical protein